MRGFIGQLRPLPPLARWLHRGLTVARPSPGELKMKTMNLLAAVLLALLPSTSRGMDPIRVSSSPQHFAVEHRHGVHLRVQPLNTPFDSAAAWGNPNATVSSPPNVFPGPADSIPGYGFPGYGSHWWPRVHVLFPGQGFGRGPAGRGSLAPFLPWTGVPIDPCPLTEGMLPRTP